eukprot:scaffold2952_cov312-Pinguiococcus_pyrenoidosus.AAC.8
MQTRTTSSDTTENPHLLFLPSSPSSPGATPCPPTGRVAQPLRPVPPSCVCCLAPLHQKSISASKNAARQTSVSVPRRLSCCVGGQDATASWEIGDEVGPRARLPSALESRFTHDPESLGPHGFLLAPPPCGGLPGASAAPSSVRRTASCCPRRRISRGWGRSRVGKSREKKKPRGGQEQQLGKRVGRKLNHCGGRKGNRESGERVVVARGIVSVAAAANVAMASGAREKWLEAPSATLMHVAF